MTNQPPPTAPVTVGTRPGGRSARVVSAVLEATRDELARVGYAALSVERVAEIAGVAKTTVYRRWPQKSELVRESLLARLDASPLPADEGNAVSQLVDYAFWRCEGMQRPEGMCTVRMLYTEGSNPEVQELVRALRSAKLKVPLEIFQRGIDRGEIPAGSDGECAWGMIMGSLHFRVFLHGESPSYEAVRELVHGALYGVVPRGTEPASGPARSTPQARSKSLSREPSRS